MMGNFLLYSFMSENLGNKRLLLEAEGSHENRITSNPGCSVQIRQTAILIRVRLIRLRLIKIMLP